MLFRSPSAPDAFVKGIMEGVEWFYDNGNWKMAEAAEDTRRHVKTLSRREIEDTALQLFENFIRKI